MQDFVSAPWIRVAAWAASASLVWTISIPHGFPWMGLVWVTLACAGALWLRTGSSRSIWQVLDVEPAWAPAALRPAARPASQTVR